MSISLFILHYQQVLTFELPNKLRHSVKGLINIKNNDNKCFLLCHIRHLNPLKIHPQRITKADENMVNDLDFEDVKFLVSKKKIIVRLNKKLIFAFMYFLLKMN